MRSRSFVGTNPFVGNYCELRLALFHLNWFISCLFSDVIVAGWGFLKENTTMTNVLQQAQVPVIDNGECKRQYVDVTRLLEGAQYRFSEKYILCTGFLGGGISPCQGDSGSPLMLPINENGRFAYHQIGIVSNAVGCARSNAPEMFTNVQQYVDWILDKLRQS